MNQRISGVVYSVLILKDGFLIENIPIVDFVIERKILLLKVLVIGFFFPLSPEFENPNFYSK